MVLHPTSRAGWYALYVNWEEEVKDSTWRRRSVNAMGRIRAAIFVIKFNFLRLGLKRWLKFRIVLLKQTFQKELCPRFDS